MATEPRQPRKFNWADFCAAIGQEPRTVRIHDTPLHVCVKRINTGCGPVSRLWLAARPGKPTVYAAFRVNAAYRVIEMRVYKKTPKVRAIPVIAKNTMKLQEFHRLLGDSTHEKALLLFLSLVKPETVQLLVGSSGS